MKEMPQVPGLVQRGKRFYYRRRVPKDISDSYDKREVVYALKTSDYSAALKLARKKAVEVDEDFDTFRIAASAPTTTASPALTSAARQRFCDAYYQQCFEDEPAQRHDLLQQARMDQSAFWRGRIVPIPDDKHLFEGRLWSFWEDVLSHDDETCLEDAFLYAINCKNESRIKFLEKAHSIGDCDGFFTTADKLANLEGRERVKLALGLMLAEVRALKDITSQDDTRLREITSKIDGASTSKKATSQDPLLSVAAKDWISENVESERWTQRRTAGCKAALALFIEITSDKPISSYTKADVREFKSILRDLPPNRSKLKLTRELDVRTAAKKARQLDLPRMSTSNVNKLLTTVGGLFKWISGNYDCVATNPFANSRIPTTSNQRDQRHSFNIDDLTKIFSAPIFVGCQSVSRWKQSGSIMLRDNSKFWLPLLALYTGARLNELCKLRVDDVREVDGIHFLDINNAKHKDDKIAARLKTPASERTIPIHKDLVALGFLEFRKMRKHDGSERLFPELKPDRYGKLSDGFSKHFSRFLDSTEVKRNKIDFHSFRHTWVDACRNSQINSDVIYALKGEALKGTLARYGDGKTNLEILNEEMKKLRFKDLDLAHLITKNGLESSGELGSYEPTLLLLEG